jgi:hypothetical protein
MNCRHIAPLSQGSSQTNIAQETYTSKITISQTEAHDLERGNEGRAHLTLADAGGGVAAGGAGALLEVEAAAAAAHAERVRLVPALAEAARTLPLRTRNTLAHAESTGNGGGDRWRTGAPAARTYHPSLAPLS